jgi:hypothetical protein
MIRIFLSIALSLLCCTAFAQELRTITSGAKDLPKIKSKESFLFLNDELDTATLTFVATFEIKSPPKSSVEKIFEVAEKEARSSGANALRLKSISEDYATTIMEAYFLDDDAIQKNRILAEKNVFYVFAGEKYDAPAYYSFEFNGAAKSIKNGTYIKFSLKEGEQAKLKKGTVSGTVMWVKWRTNQLPNYFSIHGFTKEPVVKRTTQSQSFRPGKIADVENALGAFLVKVLAEKVE